MTIEELCKRVVELEQQNMLLKVQIKEMLEEMKYVCNMVENYKKIIPTAEDISMCIINRVQTDIDLMRFLYQGEIYFMKGENNEEKDR